MHPVTAGSAGSAELVGIVDIVEAEYQGIVDIQVTVKAVIVDLADIQVSKEHQLILLELFLLLEICRHPEALMTHTL